MATAFIVSDSPEVLSVAGMTLRARGWEVREALGGRDALDALTSVRPDVLITDARLPDIPGCDLIDQVRQFEPGLPVVVMEGYFAAGVPRDWFGRAVPLAKPFVPRDLLGAVDRAMLARERFAA